MRVAANVLVLAALVGVCGCIHQKGATAQNRYADRTVKDVIIEQALYGSGTQLVDVTERVVQLLRTEPGGFSPQADWLHVDPVPGKNKSLLIRYVYRDKPRTFMVTGANRASYAALVEGK